MVPDKQLDMFFLIITLIMWQTVQGNVVLLCATHPVLFNSCCCALNVCSWNSWQFYLNTINTPNEDGLSRRDTKTIWRCGELGDFEFLGEGKASSVKSCNNMLNNWIIDHFNQQYISNVLATFIDCIKDINNWINHNVFYSTKKGWN